VHRGELDLAEQQFKKAIALSPQDYEANHNLGELFARMNNITEAIPYLQKAQQLNPGSYDNGYDLSFAYSLTGRLSEARQMIHDLVTAPWNRPSKFSARVRNAMRTLLAWPSASGWPTIRSANTTTP